MYIELSERFKCVSFLRATRLLGKETFLFISVYAEAWYYLIIFYLRGDSIGMQLIEHATNYIYFNLNSQFIY